jgi:hypothetical protein
MLMLPDCSTLFLSTLSEAAARVAESSSALRLARPSLSTTGAYRLDSAVMEHLAERSTRPCFNNRS